MPSLAPTTAPRTGFPGHEPHPPFRPGADGIVRGLAAQGQATVGTVPTDHDFMALHTAYRRHGGLARCHELSRAWAADGPALEGRLEKLIDSGLVFAFHWHHSLWLPRFQLDRHRHAGDLATAAVLDELVGSLDGWELAAWFVEPHAWLDDEAPVACLATRLPQVLDAARADRFARRG